MILAGTGHRPADLTTQGKGIYRGSDLLMRLDERLIDLCVAALRRYTPEKVISGMALGLDMALSDAAVRENIPLVAAIPFEGQEVRWSDDQQARFRRLREAAAEVVIVCEGGFSAASMQRRNEWMVDNSSLVLALWSGKPGGTGNCVRYPESVGSRIVNLYPSFARHSGLSVPAQVS